MNTFTQNFLKIIPSIRQETLDVIFNNPILGEKIKIPVNDHFIDVYFHKSPKKNAPLLFELHGGGFVFGDARKDDWLCEKIKNDTGFSVVGINYRKAPENPYPDAINDVMGAIKYFAENSTQYDFDKNKIFLMGFSAGANLATVATMKSLKADYKILGLALHYPFLNAAVAPGSRQSLPADLPSEVMEAFNELYSPIWERKNPFISPVFASDEILKSFPHTIILPAENDSLFDDAVEFYDKLKSVGVPVTFELIKNAHHGYIEDFYNLPCFELIASDTKNAMHKDFGESAEYAVNLMEKVMLSLSNEKE